MKTYQAFAQYAQSNKSIFSRMAIIRDDMNSHPEYDIKDDPEPNKMTSEEGSENKENAKPLKNSNIAGTKNQAVVKKSGKPKKTQKHWLIPQMDILSEGF